MKPILLPVLLILILTACNDFQVSEPVPYEFAGTAYIDPPPLDDFTLTSTNGPVSLSDLAGNHTYIYFGYMFCPDVCPATLSQLARVKQQLGTDSDQVQVVMITVDPDRDSAEMLADYVAYFDPTFVGLSGTKAEIDAVGKPFGLYYEKHDGTAATGYLVDHTARTFLLDPNGVIILSYGFDTPTESFLADMRYLLNS